MGKPELSLFHEIKLLVLIVTYRNNGHASLSSRSIVAGGYGIGRRCIDCGRHAFAAWLNSLQKYISNKSRMNLKLTLSNGDQEHEESLLHIPRHFNKVTS
jgi:hypothetical protein